MITSGFLSACKQFHSEVNITPTDDEEKIDSYSSLTRGILPGEFYIYYLISTLLHYLLLLVQAPSGAASMISRMTTATWASSGGWTPAAASTTSAPSKSVNIFFYLQQIFLIFFCRLSRYSHDRVSSTCPPTPSPTAAATRFSMTA